MYADWPLLSLVIWTPIVGGILVLMAGDREPAGARKIALAFSILTFALTVPLYTLFDSTTHAAQVVERASWIDAFDIDAPSIEAARRNADLEGVSDRVTFYLLGRYFKNDGWLYGADLYDLDGTVVEEKIGHDAGADSPQRLAREDLLRQIRAAERIPVERDTLYREVRVYA